MGYKFKKRALFLIGFVSLIPTLWAAAPGPTGPTPVCTDSSRNCTFGVLYQNIGIASYSGIEIIYAVSILMGIAGTIFGLLKLRQHGLDAQGSSGALRQAIYSLVISALLICVPAVALIVTGTFLGDSNIPMVPENTVANYGQSGVAN